MSNPEKNPETMGDFPPPPPGPPPYQDHHLNQSEQQQETYPADQKQQPPPQSQVSHPDPLKANPVDTGDLSKAQQATQQQPHFPPPPSQPPPHQDPVQQQQQPGDSYQIPAYNPANPVFAPPPTTEATAKPEEPAQPAHVPAGNSHHETSTATTTEEPAKKPGWSQRLSMLGLKAAAPINSLAHKMGSQSFLPETMDKECEKAAVILKTFCKKGVYADPAADQPPTSTDPKATETAGEGIIDPTKEKPKNRVIVTIPPKVISKAVGLAIFTTLRAGFHVTGATGSGILVARLPDGSWSPPSGIQVHSVGGGFSIGLDIYDCVCVINSKDALAAFMNTRVAMGSDLAVVAGPYGAGGAVEMGAAVDTTKSKDKQKQKKGEDEAAAAPAPESTPAATEGDNQNLKPEDPNRKSHRRSLSASARKPVFSYVKSRGFYAGVQIDGTVVVERKDANAAFYGEHIPVERILKGEVPPQGPAGMWPAGARVLLDVLKGAEAGALKESKDGSKDGFAPPPFASVPEPGQAAAPGTRAEAQTSGVTEEGLPGYVDDGVHRPEVGDHKYR